MKKKGGEILGQGADTCVFYPAVKCSVPTPITGETQGEFVSRIVLAKDGEHLLQQQAHTLIKRDLDDVGKSDLLRFFLFGASYCQPETTGDDFKGKECRFTKRVMTKDNTNNADYVNIITPKYDKDLEVGGKLTESQQKTRGGIRDLMMALTYINNLNTVVHFDAHFGNIGWKGDQIILTDWGRVRIGNTFTEKSVDYRHKDNYAQYYYPVTLLEEIHDEDILLTLDFKIIAIVWDILAILGSAVKYKVVGSNDGNDFFNKVVKHVKDALPRSGIALDIPRKIKQLNLAITNLKTEKAKANPNPSNINLLEQRVEFLKSEVKKVNPILTTDQLRENLRTEINTLFQASLPAPLTTPAVEPPEALSPTDLNLIQTDLFQSTSTNSLTLSPDTPKQGGRRKTRKLLQKRTRTHNIHKQTVRHSQRKGKKTTK